MSFRDNMAGHSQPRYSGTLSALLANYRQLVARVDDLCQGIEQRHHADIVCTAGCDDCCRRLSLFPVEAAALAAALRELAEPERQRIRERARAALSTAPCPLLEQQRCLLYPARPVICRTHGLPLLIHRDGEQQVDHCPRNFRGISSLPGTAVIDLDRLNETLVAVNLRFLAENEALFPWPDRLSIADALLLELNFD